MSCHLTCLPCLLWLCMFRLPFLRQASWGFGVGWGSMSLNGYPHLDSGTKCVCVCARAHWEQQALSGGPFIKHLRTSDKPGNTPECLFWRPVIYTFLHLFRRYFKIINTPPAVSFGALSTDLRYICNVCACYCIMPLLHHEAGWWLDFGD